MSSARTEPLESIARFLFHFLRVTVTRIESDFRQFFLIVVLMLWTIFGCAHKAGAPCSKLVVAGLPPGDRDLLELADSKIQMWESSKELIVAVGALNRILENSDSTILPIEVHIRLASAYFGISEKETVAKRKLDWIDRGIAAAERVVEADPQRVEGYYYLAVLKGRHAQQGGMSAIIEVRYVEKFGLKAAQLDSSFGDGAPCRLLAMLYAKAPPWPASVGDMDLALKYAKKAVEISDYPQNHLIMAEVLIAADADPKAVRKELQKVLTAPIEEKWGHEAESWRAKAKELLESLED
jgi:hypothetical protein